MGKKRKLTESEEVVQGLYDVADTLGAGPCLRSWHVYAALGSTYPVWRTTSTIQMIASHFQVATHILGSPLRKLEV